MKKILIVSSFILVLIAISTVGYNIVSANVTVDEVQDILTAQLKKEAYITPYGYTLDNPNVILNPYGISPLTAIILFETEEELPVTITVEGKDENSTYINTFESTKKHYLPIYGLYSNTINYVHVKCGNITKTIEITTEPLPIELLITETINNNTNQLTFITTDNYPYALDSNNEVRWYLTKNYSKKIDYLDNGNLLLSTDNLTPNNIYDGFIEIDLLGKIYKQYTLDTGYQGTYDETPTSIFILSTKLLEIDKQTGTILNSITLDEQYNKVFYDKNLNTINLANKTNTLSINLKNKEQTLTTTAKLNNEQQNILPLYTTNQNYQLTKGIKFNLAQETKESNQNIFLVGYIKPDKNYHSYNIDITKTIDNLQITGNFNENDDVYLILDKFLDKKVYDIDNKYTTINKIGLSGKYSIYLKINKTIYKTDNYIEF